MNSNIKLHEAILKLKQAGLIVEDTDEYDDADLGVNVDPNEYHHQKGLMRSLKDRIIAAYESWIESKEKDAENSWKRKVSYRGGGNDEDDLMNDYKLRWGEELPHKNTLTLYEFFKIMMSNESTKEYIFDNSKQKDLNGLKVGKDDYYYEGNDDDENKKVISPPAYWDLGCNVNICRNSEYKKAYKQELISVFNSSSSLKEFFKKCDKLTDKYVDEFNKLDNKIDFYKDEGEKVPKELRDKCDYYDKLSEAFGEWSGMWLEDIMKKLNDVKKCKMFIDDLFNHDFSIKFAKELYKKIMSKGKQEQPKQQDENNVPPIVKTMYETFMNKMKVPVIYRAVEIDVSWVDRELNKMANDRHNAEKVRYLLNNKYKERMGIANVNLHAVGKSWCWNSDTSAVSGKGGDTYFLVAENDPSNIDLPMSALCAAQWSDFEKKGTELTGEEEVRILNEFDVTVSDVYTGRGKNATHINRRETYYREK